MLLSVHDVIDEHIDENVAYFPAYEIVNDELRDYRFYKADMLHPNEQAVEYIWERLVDMYFSPSAKKFLHEWKPVKEAFAHRPFNPESSEYKNFNGKNESACKAIGAKIQWINNRRPMNTEQILAHLARHNVKSTANRILIAEAISKHNGPVSMKELETKLQTIDKSSIFRTLTLFSNQHVVHQMEDGNVLFATNFV